MEPKNLPTAKRPVVWIGSSLDDLKAFPAEVRSEVGHALFAAQTGETHPSAKRLKGDAFKGEGVLEIVERHDGDTYRAVYTIRFREVVYVLDAFKKKSKAGIKTPKHIIERIQQRLKAACDLYDAEYADRKTA